MKDGRKSGAFAAADYPALRESLAGYLHEDFQETSGTVTGAVELFLREAWGRLRRQFAGRPFEELQTALIKLGIAWRPAAEEELRRVDEILKRGWA